MPWSRSTPPSRRLHSTRTPPLCFLEPFAPGHCKITNPLVPCTLQAQVQFVEGGAATQELNVSVRLPNGEVVRLDGASAAAGQTIDVEWRSVDDK